jgi:dihydroflavonol-4-reductase
MATCDARDVAQATITALRRGRTGERYILGGHNTRYLELWRIFADVTGKKVRPFFTMQFPMGLIGGAWGDFCTLVTGKEGEINSAAVRMSAQLHYYCSAKAEKELDFRPRSVEESTRDAWEWFNELGYVKK